MFVLQWRRLFKRLFILFKFGVDSTPHHSLRHLLLFKHLDIIHNIELQDFAPTSKVLFTGLSNLLNIKSVR
jgi:hypothetical protein